jgi:hypothetical protein
MPKVLFQTFQIFRVLPDLKSTSISATSGLVSDHKTISG